MVVGKSGILSVCAGHSLIARTVDVCPVKGLDDIAIVEVPPLKVVGIKKIGTYALIPDLVMKVYGHVIKKKMEIAGPPIFICHETSPEAVMDANEKGTAQVEVAWPVTRAIKGTREMKIYELPGGKMVHTIHYGPYATCEPTYLKLFAWIREKGLRVSGPIREVYPNDPREVSPDAIMTEIFVPVD